LHYSELVKVYDEVSQTTKRLEITDFLVAFLKRCPPEIIDKVVYLTQGRLYPEFVPLELGVADRLIIRCIAQATATKESEVDNLYKRIGDLGNVANELLSKSSKQATLDLYSTKQKGNKVTVEHVYENLDRIAKAVGEGSQEEKIRLLSDLLRDSSPSEAMYIVRTVSGALRLGVADMTILDAMTIAFSGSKEARPFIERAYNMSSDLGTVAKTLAQKGVEAIKSFGPSPGRPIRSMLAERLSSPSEILEKMGGRCAVEYKFDGERVQIHRNTGDAGIALYSRRLENISHHYPDVIRLASEGILSDSYMVEGEIVAIDSNTGDLLPFQELMHRRRKYGVEEAMATYPASLRLFDVLYIDGKDFTTKIYPERRFALSKIVKESNLLRLAEQRIVNNPEALETFFEEAISNGCEGLVAKSLGEESIYKAGARGWLWIKYKREYKSEMMDTVDLVVVGGFMGTGKRAGHIGTLLLAAYDDSEDIFRTVCRCSTGFTDEDIKNMHKLLEKDIIPHRHGRVDSKITPDIWVVPTKVLEVLGAEITLSPIHTCGLDAIRKGAGLAIRFPRFTGNWRTDKSSEDATTVNEIIEMYKKQLKKISE
jgi:DNA ligase-1